MAKIKNISPSTVIFRTVNNKTYDIQPGQTLTVADAEVSYDNVDAGLQTGQLEVTTDTGAPFFSASGTSQSTAPVVSVTASTPLPVSAPAPLSVYNVDTLIREAFEVYDKTTKWSETLGSGDIIALDGNTVAASYLVISKDPFTAGSESSVVSIPQFKMPFEAIVGMSTSQRTTGQEFFLELASTEPSLPDVPDLAISSISQTGTSITVNTAVPHNLKPGVRIGIRDCVDSRLNYPNVVVGTTPSTTQFTIAGGTNGTLPSVTVGPLSSGFVYYRGAMGGATNGTSMVMEGIAGSQASFYVRSESGDVLPSGTLNGNHSMNIGSTNTVQAINSAGCYSFQPTTEYRCTVQPDWLAWADSPVDATGPLTNRSKRTQLIPDHTVAYKVRFRAVNRPSLSRPVAQVVSVAKSGTTTATVVTDAPHGLTTSDIVSIVGVRDQTNFANLYPAASVTGVVDANTFTVVWGSAVTATSYGGYVSRINGGNAQPGAVTVAVQSASRTANLLTLIGSATWAGMVIGDYVNVYGVRNSTNGASLGVDGVYRVRDMSSVTLVLEPIGNTTGGADIASTNCGGAVIKRTDLRISYVRVLDYERHRVEYVSKASTDFQTALQANVNVTMLGGQTVSNGGSAGSLAVSGSVAEDSAAPTNPVLIGGIARTALPASTIVAGDLVRTTVSTSGQLITKANGPRELDFQVATTITTSTQTAIRAAQAAGIRQCVTSIIYQNTNATATLVTIQDGSTTLLQFNAAANMANPVQLVFPEPLFGTAATALNYTAGTTGANVLLQVCGFNSY